MKTKSLLILLVNASCVFGSVSNAPQNTVSLVGHSVTFQCATNITNRAVIYWQFTNVNGVLQPPIYTGQMNPAYASRGFSVSNSSSSQASEYNLTIANVSLADAGTYTCHDNNGIGEPRAAWLTVLDDNPICGANDTIDIANLTRVGYLTCTVSMYGRISDSNRLVPVFNWTNCSMLQTGLRYNAIQLWTSVDDQFHRQYTSWVSVNVSDVDSVACDFTMSFVAVVSDSIIDSRQPTYSFIKSVQIARTTTAVLTTRPTTTESTTARAATTTTATTSVSTVSSLDEYTSNKVNPPRTVGVLSDTSVPRGSLRGAAQKVFQSVDLWLIVLCLLCRLL